MPSFVVQESQVNMMSEYTLIPPAPPNPGFRQNRGGLNVDVPVFPNSYAEHYITGTTDAATTATFQAWLTAHPTNNKIGLTSVGWSPEPILDEGSIPEVPVAFVNSKGELASTATDKARALKAGVPIPTDGSFTPNITSDSPASVYSPNYSVVDPLTSAVYSRRVWDMWRLWVPGTTWLNNTASRTADRGVTGISINNGSATISFSAGMITQSADAGKTFVHVAFPANTYIISATSTQAVLSNVATTGGPLTNQTGTLTPTNPAVLSWPVYECQNAARFLDLDNNASWPIDRYFGQGGTASKLPVVEDAIWASTATRKSYLAGMLLGEDIDMYVNGGGKLMKHTIDLAVPFQNGTHVWPAQGNDTTAHFDATVPMTEGLRFRLNMGTGETPGASMPATDAAIDALSIHTIAKVACKAWARYGGMFWDATQGSFTIRWDSKLANYFGATPYYNIMNGVPFANFEIVNVGSDINWNP